MLVFLLEFLFGLNKIRIGYDALIYGTNELALRFIMGPHTFGTFECINDENGITFGDRFVGTLNHARVTSGAIFQDI